MVLAGSYMGYTPILVICRVPTILVSLKQIACKIIKVKCSGEGKNLLNLDYFPFSLLFFCW